MDVASNSESLASWASAAEDSRPPLPAELNVLDCLPPLARADAQQITLLDVDMSVSNDREYVQFEIGWVASTDRAKRAFDSVIGQCDAGCGRSIAVADVVQFGMCGHLVCPECSEGGAFFEEIYPGAGFCPHEECRRSRELAVATCPTASTVSSQSLFTCILLKITVFFLKNGHVQTLRWKEENSGEGRMAAVVEYILDRAGLPPAEDNGYFFSTADHPRLEDWKPLRLEESPFIWSLTPHEGELLNLVVTGPGVCLDKCL